MSSNDPLTLVISKADAERLSVEMAKLAVVIQDKILKVSIKRFNDDVIRSASALTPLASGASRRALAQKSRNYGGILWGAVGYKTLGKKSTDDGDRSKHAQWDSAGAGWRSHFIEAGYHSWPKGRENRNKGKSLGRAWKRGQNHRGVGLYHRGTFATMRAQAANAPKLMAYIWAAITEATNR